MDIIVDYMSQIVLNKKCQLHCVSFEFTNHIVNVSIHFCKKNMAYLTYI